MTGCRSAARRRTCGSGKVPFYRSADHLSPLIHRRYKIFHNMSYANRGYAVAGLEGLWYGRVDIHAERAKAHVCPVKPSRDISRLLEIMAALRTPGTGCPWDLEQN